MQYDIQLLVSYILLEAVAGQNDADKQNDRDDDGNYSQSSVRKLVDP